VQLNELVAGMTGMLRRVLGEDLQPRTDLAEDLAPVRIDAVLIEQVVLTVRDTGIGMSPEVLGHAFEPFFTTKEIGKGTGLATSYGAVKQSGGYITVASVEGRGTTFSIWFPAATWTPEPAGRAGESPPPAAAERARPGEVVQLVEDERPVRDIAQRHLADAGYVVLPAAGSEEALAAARAAEGHPPRDAGALLLRLHARGDRPPGPARRGHHVPPQAVRAPGAPGEGARGPGRAPFLRTQLK
jgi:hypothetical protein